MCNRDLSRYTLCAHKVTTKTRCPFYLHNPRLTCEKTNSETTRFAKCPKCLGMTQPFVTQRDIEDDNSKDTGGGGSGSGSSFNLKWIKKGIKSVGERSMGGSEKILGTGIWLGIAQAERPMSESNVLVGIPYRKASSAKTRRSESEKLAEGYQKAIGVEPSIEEVMVKTDEVGEKQVDVETMTTWSKFLPRSSRSLGEKDSIIAKEMAPFGGIYREQKVAEEAHLPELVEEPERLEEEHQNPRQNPYQSSSEIEEEVEDLAEQPLEQNYAYYRQDERLMEELRIADNRLRVVRDGRGSKEFPSCRDQEVVHLI